jgi:hypothetical protein
MSHTFTSLIAPAFIFGVTGSVAYAQVTRYLIDKEAFQRRGRESLLDLKANATDLMKSKIEKSKIEKLMNDFATEITAEYKLKQNDKKDVMDDISNMLKNYKP